MGADVEPSQAVGKFAVLMHRCFESVLWIRIGFNADPDPAFYLNADADPDAGSQNADPCGSIAWSDFLVIIS